MPKTKKLTDINITHISLVKAGANGKEFIYKSAADEGGYENVINIKKTDEEQGIVYGIVYAPGEVDSQGDSADADEILKAAYSFMKSLNARNIDVDHSFNNEDAFVAESWIVKGGDPIFGDEPEGAWAVAIKLESEELKALAKSGELAGLSMAGNAKKTEVEKAEGGGYKKFFQALGEATTGVWVEFGAYLEKSKDKGDIDMDKFAKIVKEKIDKSLKEAQGAASEMQKAADVQATKIEKMETFQEEMKKKNEEMVKVQKELESENAKLKETNDDHAKTTEDAKAEMTEVQKSLKSLKDAYTEVTEVVKASKQSGDFKKVEEVIKNNAKVVM